MIKCIKNEKRFMQNSYKRVDAHLSSLGYCSRSEVPLFLKRNQVAINGVKVYDPKIKAHHDQVTVNSEVLDPEILTILMNKPLGVICSHNDAGKLIYSLLPKRWQQRNPQISTVGRLDMDTTGAIILTDNGQLNHQLSSPKSKASKIYEATLADALKGNEADIFASGELLLKGEKKPLLPARMEILSPTKVHLEIVEGKYHQVKRMFGAVGNKVIALHRIDFNGLNVEGLMEGEYKLVEI